MDYSIIRMASDGTNEVFISYPNAKETKAGAGYLPITGQHLPLLFLASWIYFLSVKLEDVLWPGKKVPPSSTVSTA